MTLKRNTSNQEYPQPRVMFPLRDEFEFTPSSAALGDGVNQIDDAFRETSQP